MNEKQILTNSSLTAFKVCPRKYDIQYRMGYVPVKDAEPLYFGKLFHAGLEAWSLNSRSLEAAHLQVKEIFRKSADQDQYMLVKILALLTGYHEKYKNEEYEIVAVERQFRAPLLNPETAQSSRIYELGGMVDRIIKDKSGRILLLETKTAGEEIENPAADYWRKLLIDSQVSGYYLGAEAMGYRIENCIYDVIRKPTISPYRATPAESRKYTKEGKLYANQREVDETPEEYHERLLADIASRPSFYYARREVPRSKGDLFDYLSDVWQVAQSIRAFEKIGKFPRYTNSCVSTRGKCPYFEACVGSAPLEDPYAFRKKESTHEELEPVKEVA